MRPLQLVQDARQFGGYLAQVVLPWPDARAPADKSVDRGRAELRRGQQHGLAGVVVADEGELARQGQADRDGVDVDEHPGFPEVDVSALQLGKVLVRAVDPDGPRIAPRRRRARRGVEGDAAPQFPSAPLSGDAAPTRLATWIAGNA
ncbi:hypothetical protein THAOC_08797 [Thalassiosira oceanica]|uniref:Uncharacterized protein n=1 Tax=Thalassiosira oceanica TaxID=159749 RepID=K0T915_THAOC|nr:hypothetical protein THAOC_08797 [Thalassiosira oceanica]|eukprot:EJK69906.1 hypothetical protein THAOC_08797 [Thalassiosira oceanica]